MGWEVDEPAAGLSRGGRSDYLSIKFVGVGFGRLLFFGVGRGSEFLLGIKLVGMGSGPLLFFGLARGP